MKKKLTEMTKDELVAYCNYQLRMQRKLQEGSRHWQKFQRRIERANKQLEG